MPVKTGPRKGPRSAGGRGAKTGGRFRGPGGGPGGGGRFFVKKICRLCADRVEFFDYKDADRLKRYLTEKGKIVPRRVTGNCAKCQRMVARAIKRARQAGIIAFQMD